MAANERDNAESTEFPEPTGTAQDIENPESTGVPDTIEAPDAAAEVGTAGTSSDEQSMAGATEALEVPAADAAEQDAPVTAAPADPEAPAADAAEQDAPVTAAPADPGAPAGTEAPVDADAPADAEVPADPEMPADAETPAAGTNADPVPQAMEQPEGPAVDHEPDAAQAADDEPADKAADKPADKKPATKRPAAKKPAQKKPADDEPADVAAEETSAEPAQADPFAVPADPLALIFQAPDLSAIPPAPSRRRDREDQVSDQDEFDDEGGREDRDVTEDGEDRGDADSEDRSSGSRRSRRRRGRGRSGGGSADRVSGDSGDEETGARERGQDGGQSAAQDGEAADDQPGGEGNGDGSGTRRRRRRRRGDVDMELEGGGGDDPENTVTRVRAPRQSSSTSTGPQGVTSLKGSTRLEAKRQRRRESRSGGRQRRHVITEAEFLARRESVDRKMLVRQREQRIQIAVMEDGVLAEHFVSNTTQDSMIGNVYLGKVQNVLPSMEAAFVDIGRGRNAVLYAGEVNWDAANLEGKARKIENALKSGDSVLVQVTKDPVGHKGARLTSQISLPGRYLVYVPGGSMTGISRKLPDVERSRLKKILKDHLPENAGVIVRTAAEGTSEQELMNDINRLRAQWEGIEAKSRSTKTLAPELLYSEPDLTIKVVRDVFNEDFSGMVVQGPEVWDNIEAYVTYVAPHLLDRLSQWKPEDHGGEDLFASNRIDEQLHKALDRKVYLPSGGSLVIDRTEAMTVVDVNTGKFTGSGGNLEETVTKNNLEAAEEIVRQLRLRDIGGIIVIDFIDMVLESNRDLVLRRLVECLGRDRTKHQVAEVTSLGLVQMTRKRMGTGLVEIFSETCEHCNGRGIIIHDVPVEHRRAHNSHGEPRSGGGGGGGDTNDGGARKSSRSERRRRSRERQAEREREELQEAPTEPQLSPEEEAERKARAEAARAALRNIAAATQHAHEPEAAESERPAKAAEPAQAAEAVEPAQAAEPVGRSGRRRSRRAGSDQGQPVRQEARPGDRAEQAAEGGTDGAEQSAADAAVTGRGRPAEEPSGPTLTIAGETVEVPRGRRAPRRASSQKDLSSLEDALDQRAPKDQEAQKQPEPESAQQPAAAPAEKAPAPASTAQAPTGKAAPVRRRRRAASSDGTSGEIQTVEVTAGSSTGHRFSASVGTPAEGAAAVATGSAGEGAQAPVKAAEPTIIGVGVKAEDIARTE
ncbi:MAG: Rne/Rng family ribonuclease [Micrococcus sp.]|nr:Rne/Rng family ribonuclease [Micrococcus sp.]